MPAMEFRLRGDSQVKFLSGDRAGRVRDLLLPELRLRLSARRGERIYVHAKPCILVPRITLTVAFREEAIPVYSDLRAGHREDGRMVDTTGEVIGSQVEGMERRVIGQMQAWYYPSGT